MGMGVQLNVHSLSVIRFAPMHLAVRSILGSNVRTADVDYQHVQVRQIAFVQGVETEPKILENNVMTEIQSMGMVVVQLVNYQLVIRFVEQHLGVEVG
jgi:hypothetical protein